VVRAALVVVVEEVLGSSRGEEGEARGLRRGVEEEEEEERSE
jgi:hypothetical protein